MASHFSLSTEPALAVLPTGVGKTAVMTIIPFLVPTTRVLVIAPSKLVRHQIVEEFTALKTLRKTMTIPDVFRSPRTKEVRGRLSSVGDWDALRRFEVVVGTPQSLSGAIPGVAPVPVGMFDLVLVDEAHHVPAKTWQWLVDAFPRVRRGFFTATPFRTDRQSIPGKIVFTYPMASALADGVFAPVAYRRVDAPADDAHRDADLAAAAVARLRSPEHVAGRSLLLVRTNRKRDAHDLVVTYRAAGIEIGAILADSAPGHVDAVLRKLADGSLKGLVTVGVVGEGFDEPRLKVAAYHRPHRSLPATLQFLGRLARVRPEGGPAELLAYADDVADETRVLYESDASWATLVPQLAEMAITEEVERNEYAQTFRPALPKAFSLHAVHPPREVRIFEVGPTLAVNLKFDAPRKLGDGKVLYHGIDAKAELTFTVTEHAQRPRWLLTDALDSFRYECHIITTVKTAANATLIFILSDSESMHARLLREVGATDAPRLSPEDVNQILHAMKLLSASSVGLRAGSSGWGRRPEYKTLAGSKVNNAVRGADAHGYNFGHIMALHQEDGRFETVGASTGRAKIWKPGNVPLLEYRKWCESLAKHVDSAAVGSKVPLFDVHVPSRAVRFPVAPFALSLPSLLLEADIEVQRDDESWSPLAALTFSVTRSTDDLCRVEVDDAGSPVASYDVNLRGQFTPVRDADSRVPGSPTNSPFSEVLSSSSTAILFADGSAVADGSHIRPPESLPDFPSNLLHAWPWDGVDIRSETTAAPPLRSIHAAVQRRLEDDDAHAWIIYDDAAHEIADFAVIGVDPGNTSCATINLVHCKFSGTELPGRDVANLYDVVGQAVRSGKWSAVPAAAVFKDLARRVRERTATRIVRGDRDNLLQLLVHWSDNPPRLKLVVTIVQPGLDIEKAHKGNEVRALLVAANEWLDRMNATLRVVGSRVARDG
jgi:superfamily II DNA or RNA helicase